MRLTQPTVKEMVRSNRRDRLALELIAHRADPTAIAPALDARRRARVTSVQKTAWRIGAMGHWKNPVARWFRNTMLRMVPQSTTDKTTLKLWQPGIDLAAELREAGYPQPSAG